MRIEIVVPVWGRWMPRWIGTGLPCIRAALADLGPDAALVVYTDFGGVETVRQAAPEAGIRQIGDGFGVMDPCDMAHADALDRALEGGFAVAPLVANQVFGRGSLNAARAALDAGKRAAMAVLVPAKEPPPVPSCGDLCAWILGHGGVLTWDRRPWSEHPGHIAWRSASGAILVRMIYVPPLLILPERAHVPDRAIDHFMAEGYLSDFGSIAALPPSEACTVGINYPSGPQQGPVPIRPDRASPEFVAEWGRCNMRPWNARYLAEHFYWVGEPGEDRADIEEQSGRITAEIGRLLAA